MSAAIDLDIAASGVHARRRHVDSAARRAWRAIARKSSTAPTEEATVIDGAIGEDSHAIGSACEAALDRLQPAQALHVRLGFDCSRVALIATAGGTTGSRLQFDAETIAHAWLKAMWGMDTQGWLLRCEAASATSMLVSCVRAEAIEALRTLATRRRLRLESCKPAVLDGIPLATRTEGGEKAVLWQETDAGGTGVAQFFGARNGALLATWRGRLPACDDPLDGHVARLKGAAGLGANAPVALVQWPRNGSGPGGKA